MLGGGLNVPCLPESSFDRMSATGHKRPFLCRHADPVEILLRYAEIVEFAHRVGLQIDADAERTHLADRLEHDARHADLMQRQGRRQPANAAAGDYHRKVRHTQDPVCNLLGSINHRMAADASHLRTWRRRRGEEGCRAGARNTAPREGETSTLRQPSDLNEPS